MSLTDALMLYRDSGIYPFHMPGHKRNFYNFLDYGIDVTEIDGFDNLHYANGILANGMKKAAELYGSKHTFYLINGSTCGILAGISACTKKGDKILIARNCHKSVYDAIKLNELNPVYILPPTDELGINGSIFPDAVKNALDENPGIKFVVITSPTYEGVISDITSIAKIVHGHSIPLFVDEAHGAHLGFSDSFSKNSVQCGADIVVHSLHKTLPSPTQTALLHINGNLIDPNEVQRQLSVFETSSPSYLLMAGIDSCIDLLTRQKNKLFSDYFNRLDSFYRRMKVLKNIRLLKIDAFTFDKGKIIISVKNTNITSTELKNILLNKYLLQLEMAMGDFALAMTSICDTDEGFERLGDALLEIDSTLISNMKEQCNTTISELPEKILISHEAESCSGNFMLFSESIGRIAREYVFAYPPGIPMLVPGEKISKQIIDSVIELTSKGVSVKSTYGSMPNEINIVIGNVNLDKQ
ncbi:MAG TPA: amino acid decarboxylase [Clostridiales bacterium]|nr:amino acid decarboxylase [Clostridiales bacterium]